jgi:hypothetical protein
MTGTDVLVPRRRVRPGAGLSAVDAGCPFAAGPACPECSNGSCWAVDAREREPYTVEDMCEAMGHPASGLGYVRDEDGTIREVVFCQCGQRQYKPLKDVQTREGLL